MSVDCVRPYWSCYYVMSLFINLVSLQFFVLTFLSISALSIYLIISPFLNLLFFSIRNEPITSSPHQQEKKRRRKDLAEGPGESNEGDARKHLKVRKKAAGRSLTLPEKDYRNPTLVMALPSVNCEDLMVQNQSNSSEVIVKKKSAIVKKALHRSPSKITNDVAIAEEKGEVLKAGVLPAKNCGSKLKDGNEFSGTSNQMLHKKSLGTGEDVGQSSQQGEKIKIGEKSGNIVSEARSSMKAMVSYFINFSYLHLHVLTANDVSLALYSYQISFSELYICYSLFKAEKLFNWHVIIIPHLVINGIYIIINYCNIVAIIYGSILQFETY